MLGFCKEWTIILRDQLNIKMGVNIYIDYNLKSGIVHNQGNKRKYIRFEIIIFTCSQDGNGIF